MQEEVNFLWQEVVEIKNRWAEGIFCVFRFLVETFSDYFTIFSILLSLLLMFLLRKFFIKIFIIAWDYIIFAAAAATILFFYFSLSWTPDLPQFVFLLVPIVCFWWAHFSFVNHGEMLAFLTKKEAGFIFCAILKIILRDRLKSVVINSINKHLKIPTTGWFKKWLYKFLFSVFKIIATVKKKRFLPCQWLLSAENEKSMIKAKYGNLGFRYLLLCGL